MESHEHETHSCALSRLHPRLLTPSDPFREYVFPLTHRDDDVVIKQEIVVVISNMHHPQSNAISYFGVGFVHRSQI